MNIELNSIEKQCKAYYLKGLNPEQFISAAQNLPDLSKPDLSAFKDDSHILFFEAINRFQEDKFIPPGYDVWLMHAPRYVPVKNHSHDFLELVYVYNGSCTQYVNNVPYHMREGELHFLAVGAFHHIYLNDDDCIVFHIMARESTFDTAFLSLLNHDDALSTFFALSLFKNKQDAILKFNTAGDKKLKDLISQLFTSSQSIDEYTPRQMNILFEWLCLHMVKNYVSDMHYLNDDLLKSNIASILNYIAKNYRTITIDLLCAHFNYSRGHLQRLIKKNTGMTLSTILNNQKINHACQLLKNKGVKINDIYEKVGFNNLRHFQRVFKAYKGMTASDYRLKNN